MYFIKIYVLGTKQRDKHKNYTIERLGTVNI